MPRTRSARRFCVLFAQSAALAIPALAAGAVSLNSGSVTWTWDADTNSALGGKTTFAISPPAAGSLNSLPYQLDRSGSSGGATATGKGSSGYVINPTTASYTFRAGTGSAQNDPSDVFTGDTVTKVVFRGLFDVTGSSFGPTATGFFSLTVGGIAGIGGQARVAGDMVFRLNSSSGANLRSPINFSDTFNGGASPTAFNKTYTYNAPFGPSQVAAGQKVFVQGSLTFTASNFGSPSDIRPIQFEGGSAPPTATAYLGGTNVWTDPATWAPPAGSFTEPGAIVPAVPNDVGVRARIVDVGNTSGTRTFQLPSAVTVGALQIDDDNQININSLGEARMIFESDSDNVSIAVGNTNSPAGVAMNTPVMLSDPMDIRVDRADTAMFLARGTSAGLSFNAPIGSTLMLREGPVGIDPAVTVRGSGDVTFNSRNTYNGETLVTEDGFLTAAASESLSNGTATASGGTLRIASPTATALGSGIFAERGGQIDVRAGAVGSQTFNVERLSIISGPAVALSAMTIGQNLQIAPGAVIGHETFSTGANGNPIGLPMNTPTYIFGITTDLGPPSSGNFTVGDESNSPWVGLGGGRDEIDYGDGSGGLIIAGDAMLTSGGRLDIMSPISMTGVGATITVDGMTDVAESTVAFMAASNSFGGAITVADQATLRVNGNLPAVQTTTVSAGGRLGGRGTVGGETTVANDGILDPGDDGRNGELVADFTVTELTLLQNSLLVFDFGTSNPDQTSDRLIVNGDLTLDGQLLVRQMQFFEDHSSYPIISWTGNLINNGLEFSPLNQEFFGIAPNLISGIEVVINPGGGGTVFVRIPEPATLAGFGLLGAGAIVRRRPRR